jgi:hypothetical protein
MGILAGSKVKQFAREYVDLAIESMCAGVWAKETGQWSTGSAIQHDISERTAELLKKVRQAGPEIAAKFRKAAMDRLLATRVAAVMPAMRRMAASFGMSAAGNLAGEDGDHPISGPEVEAFKIILTGSPLLNA